MYKLFLSFLLLMSALSNLFSQEANYRFYDFDVIIDYVDPFQEYDYQYILANYSATERNLEQNTLYLVEYNYIQNSRIPIDTLFYELSDSQMDSIFEFTGLFSRRPYV